MEVMSLLDNLHLMPLHWGLFLFYLGIRGGHWSSLHLFNSSLYVAALLFDLGDGRPLSPPAPPPIPPFCQALLLFSTYEFFFLAIFF
jgi:hypothetical protein